MTTTPDTRPPETRTALVALSKWIDEGNTHRDPEAVTWGRLAKITEEAGEVIEAFIGATGQNPRKGVFKTFDDVRAELLDVAVTALAAYEHVDEHRGRALTELADKIRGVAARAGVAPQEQEEAEDVVVFACGQEIPVSELEADWCASQESSDVDEEWGRCASQAQELTAEQRERIFDQKPAPSPDRESPNAEVRVGVHPPTGHVWIEREGRILAHVYSKADAEEVVAALAAPPNSPVNFENPAAYRKLVDRAHEALKLPRGRLETTKRLAGLALPLTTALDHVLTAAALPTVDEEKLGEVIDRGILPASERFGLANDERWRIRDDAARAAVEWWEKQR